MSSQDDLDLNAPHNYSDGADGKIQVSRGQDNYDHGAEATSPLRADSDEEDSMDLLAPHNYSDGADGVVRVHGYRDDSEEGATLLGAKGCSSDDELEVGQFEHSYVYSQSDSYRDSGAGSVRQRDSVTDSDANDGSESDSGSEDSAEATSASSDAQPDRGSEDRDRESTPPRTMQHTDGTSMVEDTPARQHTTSSRSYQLGNLDDMRKAVQEHVGSHAVQLSLDEFAERLLPPLSYTFNTRKILRKLTEGGLFDHSEMVLTGFATQPTSSEEREEDVFAPLAVIFQEICRLASEVACCARTEYFLGMLPNYEPYSEVSMKHRPDGSLLPKSKREFVDKATCVKGETEAEKKKRLKEKHELEEQKEHITFHDILVPLEFKKHLSDRNNNIAKITFHGQQLIAHDPRRRFVIGVTIENTEMRLWFLSRTAPIVSEVFNFTTDIKRLIHVVLSLSFASGEDLGFDSTVKLVSDGSNHQYTIKVGKRKYRTIKMIADIKAHALISTGGRVWEVIEDDSDISSPDRLILKDTWIEADRDPEKGIHESILRDVRQKYGELISARVAKGLLTPIADWSVVVDHEYDRTRDTSSGSITTELFPLREEKRRPVPIRSGSRGRGPPGSHTLDNRQTDCAEVQSRPIRRHYRVVFAEVATPLYNVEKLSYAFRILRDTAESLKYIHGCGWVHRDLSSSNLYFYRGHGLIGDLEYARRSDSKTVAHSMRTRHNDYMATEVMNRGYLFFQVDPERQSSPTFVHNELHDLESLWWTAVYVIFFMLDTSFDKEPDEKKIEAAARKRNTTRMNLFPGTNAIKHRKTFLTEQPRFLENLDWIPESLREIRTALNYARGRLVQRYDAFEKTFEVTDFADVHEAFISSFTSCEDVAASVENRVEATLVIGTSNGASVSTVLPEADTNETQNSENLGLLGGAGDNSGPLSGQGLRSQKRKRSSDVVAGYHNEQTDRPELSRGSSKHPHNLSGSQNIGEMESQKKGK